MRPVKINQTTCYKAICSHCQTVASYLLRHQMHAAEQPCSHTYTCDDAYASDHITPIVFGTKRYFPYFSYSYLYKPKTTLS